MYFFSFLVQLWHSLSEAGGVHQPVTGSGPGSHRGTDSAAVPNGPSPRLISSHDRAHVHMSSACVSSVQLLFVWAGNAAGVQVQLRRDRVGPEVFLCDSARVSDACRAGLKLEPPAWAQLKLSGLLPPAECCCSTWSVSVAPRCANWRRRTTPSGCRRTWWCTRQRWGEDGAELSRQGLNSNNATLYLLNMIICISIFLFVWL